MARNDPLQPLHRGALWTRLALTTPQVATLADVTVRQVSYWARQGYLPRAPQAPERFNGDAVDMCVLIKQGLAQGASLHAAGEAAAAYLADQYRAQPQISVLDPALRARMAISLRTAEVTLSGMREVLQALIPPPADPADPTETPDTSA
jgi:DNA-binding transcriptional MerR regulator